MAVEEAAPLVLEEVAAVALPFVAQNEAFLSPQLVLPETLALRQFYLHRRFHEPL